MKLVAGELSTLPCRLGTLYISPLNEGFHSFSRDTKLGYVFHLGAVCLPDDILDLIKRAVCQVRSISLAHDRIPVSQIPFRFVRNDAWERRQRLSRSAVGASREDLARSWAFFRAKRNYERHHPLFIGQTKRSPTPVGKSLASGGK